MQPSKGTIALITLGNRRYGGRQHIPNASCSKCGTHDQVYTLGECNVCQACNQIGVLDESVFFKNLQKDIQH